MAEISLLRSEASGTRSHYLRSALTRSERSIALKRPMQGSPALSRTTSTVHVNHRATARSLGNSASARSSAVSPESRDTATVATANIGHQHQEPYDAAATIPRPACHDLDSVDLRDGVAVGGVDGDGATCICHQPRGREEAQATTDRTSILAGGEFFHARGGADRSGPNVARCRSRRQGLALHPWSDGQFGARR